MLHWYIMLSLLHTVYFENKFKTSKQFWYHMTHFFSKTVFSMHGYFFYYIFLQGNGSTRLKMRQKLDENQIFRRPYLKHFTRHTWYWEFSYYFILQSLGEIYYIYIRSESRLMGLSLNACEHCIKFPST